MTQAERDRLVTLKKAKKRLITQREAAEELGLSVRQVKRLLKERRPELSRLPAHSALRRSDRGTGTRVGRPQKSASRHR